MSLTRFFCGGVTYHATAEGAAPLLDLCMRCGIPYTDLRNTPDGILVTFFPWHRKGLEKAAAGEGIPLTLRSVSGLPAILWRYRRRYGILLGGILAAVLVWLSGQFIREICVVGNETVTASEILGLLEEQGLHVGSYAPHINTDRVENSLLKSTDRLSWISVNILGGRAEVEVREYAAATPVLPEKKPANLVAKADGVIEEVRIYRGKTVVKAGQFVRKGELLVSGLYDSTQVGFRFTRAAGEVLARTETEIYIEIPYEYEGIRYTGAEYYDKYLIFFDYLINISKNSGNLGALYDKIDIVEECCLPNGEGIPLELRTVKYSEYEKVKMTRTPAEAEALAYAALSERLSALAEDAILLRKSVTPGVGEASFSLFCRVTVIGNIAEVKEFEVDMSMLEE